MHTSNHWVTHGPMLSLSASSFTLHVLPTRVIALFTLGMAGSREAVLLLHPTPHTVKFADTVRVRFDCGVEHRESLKTPKKNLVSRRKLALQDIEVVSPCSTSAFDAADSEDDELRLYMETLPCDRDLCEPPALLIADSNQNGFEELSEPLRM
jgi:hypothetical protein